MQQYVSWANSTGGVVQQFYTDTSIQVSLYFLYTTHDLGKLVNQLNSPVLLAQHVCLITGACWLCKLSIAVWVCTILSLVITASHLQCMLSKSSVIYTVRLFR